MGKFKDRLTNDWNTMWQKDNLGGTITGLVGGLGSAVGAGITNAKIQDTSDDEAFIEDVGNQQFGSGSLDSLMASFDAVNGMARTNYTGDELKALSTGQHLTNLGLSTLGGFTQGAGSGNLVSGLVGAGMNAIGSGIGWLTEKSRARNKANELNRLAEDANKQYLNNFANAASNTQNKMFNNSLLNIAAYGGPLFSHSGDWSNGLTFIDEGGTHEQNPLGGVPVGVDPEGVPNLVEEGEIIWNDYVFSNRLKPTKKQLETAGYNNKYDNWTFAKIVEDVQKISAETPVDKISTDTLNDNLMQLVAMQEEIRMKKEKKEANKFAKGGKVNILDGNANSQSLLGLFPLDENIIVENIPIEIEDVAIDTSYELPTPQYMHVYNGKAENISDYEFKKRLEDGTAIVGDKYKSKNKYPWQSALRYASPLVHGLTLLNNLQKPDYSDEKALMKRANNVTRGSYTPLGNTLDLDLVDKNVYTNPILANASATRRAIMQNSTNAGSANAALLANNYLTNTALGAADIQGIQANNDIKSQKAQFDLTRDQANSQMGLQALVMDQQADQLSLSTMADAIQSMNAKNTMRNQAISSSLTGLTSDLGDIGNEYIDRAQFNNMIAQGIIPPGYTNIWTTRNNKSTTETTDGKNGGLLTRNRRRK